jgi:hypothetical protein
MSIFISSFWTKIEILTWKNVKRSRGIYFPTITCSNRISYCREINFPTTNYQSMRTKKRRFSFQNKQKKRKY